MRKLRKKPELDEVALLRVEVLTLRERVAALETEKATLVAKTQPKPLTALETMQRMPRHPRIPPQGGLLIHMELSRGAGCESYHVEQVIDRHTLLSPRYHRPENVIVRVAEEMAYAVLNGDPRQSFQFNVNRGY